MNPSSEPSHVKINDGSDRDWRLISMYELQKLEYAINEECVGKNDGCPPGHLKEMHDSGNHVINKARARPATNPSKFTKNCMCDKYTNCMDCQQHDEEIHNKALDKIDKELARRVTSANERAKKMQSAGYIYSAAGDQHEGLCLASMRDYIRNECRKNEQTSPTIAHQGHEGDTMTEQTPRQYFISDLQMHGLNPIIDAIASCDPETANKGERAFKKWLDEIRSNPIPTPRTIPENYIHAAKYPPVVNRRNDGQLTLTFDYWSLTEHDIAIHNHALDELRDAIRNTKKAGTIEPEEPFHWTGIIAIIDSLRKKEQP